MAIQAKVRVQLKKKSKREKMCSGKRIAEDVLLNFKDHCNKLENMEAMRRAANRYKGVGRPKNPNDLMFDLSIYQIPEKFLEHHFFKSTSNSTS